MRTFAEILEHLNQLDNASELVEPAEFQAALDDVLEKVDRIYVVLGRMESEANSLRARSAEFLQKASVVERNAKALEEHVGWVMKQQNATKLPGHNWTLQLIATNPSVDVERQATAIEAEIFPDLVRVETKTTYNWDKKALAVKLKADAQSIPFAKLKQGHRIDFKPRVSE